MILWTYRTTKFAMQNFWRNLWLSVITIFILILTLFSISIIASLNLVADQAIKSVKEKVDVDFFFKPEIGESHILSAQVFLEELPEVKEVTYISQTMALDKFKQEHLEDETIQTSLEELKDNPLPASLVVKAESLENYDNIISKIEESEFDQYIQDKNFSDHKMVITRLYSITTRMYQIGIGVSLIFIFFSIIMVFNTVRIAIYSHRDELGIMRLVGATNWFIRAPFLLESILYALIASITTMLMLYPMIVTVSPYINQFFTGYNFNILNYYNNYIWHVFALQLFISLILSISSSMLAMSRYLKK